MKRKTEWDASARFAVIVLLATAGLSACGGSPNDQVAQTCMEGIAAQLGDQPFEGDAKQFAAAARDEGEGIVVIESTVIVDKGLTSEKTRGFSCRVQTDPQGKSPPSLILLQVGY